MYDLIAVQKLERLQHFTANGGDLALVHTRLGDHIGQRATRQVFHHNPQFLAHQIAIQIIDHIRMLVLSHHQDLIDNQFFFRLLRQIHLLDSHFHAGGALNGRVHGARGTLADFLHFRILAIWIADADNRAQSIEDLLVGHLFLFDAAAVACDRLRLSLLLLHRRHIVRVGRWRCGHGKCWRAYVLRCGLMWHRMRQHLRRRDVIRIGRCRLIIEIN